MCIFLLILPWHPMEDFFRFRHYFGKQNRLIVDSWQSCPLKDDFIEKEKRKKEDDFIYFFLFKNSEGQVSEMKGRWVSNCL